MNIFICKISHKNVSKNDKLKQLIELKTKVKKQAKWFSSSSNKFINSIRNLKNIFANTIMQTDNDNPTIEKICITGRLFWGLLPFKIFIFCKIIINYNKK